VLAGAKSVSERTISGNSKAGVGRVSKDGRTLDKKKELSLTRNPDCFTIQSRRKWRGKTQEKSLLGFTVDETNNEEENIKGGNKKRKVEQRHKVAQQKKTLLGTIAKWG